jgi:transposase-like protein
MDETGERLRRAVADLPPGSRRRRVPTALRAEVARYVRAERAAGTTWSRISARVGLSKVSLRRWTEPARTGTSRSGGAARALRAVRIGADPGPAPASALVLILPRGARIEGLQLCEAIELARALA